MRHPFDESVTNIEDRVWARKVLADGLKIIYEPEASVYHWHGIHQELNPDRARGVVRILESLDGVISKSSHQDPRELRIFAIIPVRGKSHHVGDVPLLKYAIQAAKESSYIEAVFVATDDPETAAMAVSLGAEAPFLRPQSLSEDYIDVMDVARYTLEQIEMRGISPDLIVLLEETYPFRPPKILDSMIQQIIEEGLDVVMAARREARGIWLESNSEITLHGEGFMPRRLKQSQAIIGLLGLGCVTYPMHLRRGDLFDGKIGVMEVKPQLCAIEVNSDTSSGLAEQIVGWWEKSYAERFENV
jgi:hypothetical protein